MSNRNFDRVYDTLSVSYAQNKRILTVSTNLSGSGAVKKSVVYNMLDDLIQYVVPMEAQQIVSDRASFDKLLNAGVFTSNTASGHLEIRINGLNFRNLQFIEIFLNDIMAEVASKMRSKFVLLNKFGVQERVDLSLRGCKIDTFNLSSDLFRSIGIHGTQIRRVNSFPMNVRWLSIEAEMTPGHCTGLVNLNSNTLHEILNRLKAATTLRSIKIADVECDESASTELAQILRSKDLRTFSLRTRDSRGRPTIQVSGERQADVWNVLVMGATPKMIAHCASRSIIVSPNRDGIMRFKRLMDDMVRETVAVC